MMPHADAVANSPNSLIDNVLAMAMKYTSEITSRPADPPTIER